MYADPPGNVLCGTACVDDLMVSVFASDAAECRVNIVDGFDFDVFGVMYVSFVVAVDVPVDCGVKIDINGVVRGVSN